MSGKRPSLAETMRQAVQAESIQPLASASVPPLRSALAAPVQTVAANTEPARARSGGYYAAPRAGKKKVPVAVDPATHKRLKALSVERETTTEALLQQAIAHLLDKHD